MKKLLITDLDDTLYGWLDFFIPSFYAMVNEVVKITEIDKSTLLKEYKEKHQYYGSVEYPFVTLQLPSIRQKYSTLTEVELKKLLGEAFHKFNSVRKKRLKLLPNVEETLRTLHEKGITIIGYTESSQENGYYRLKKLGVDHYFKHIYASASNFKSDYPLSEKVKCVKTKKPDKNVIIDICNNECCDLKDIIYIGDSLTKDIYMASLAGVTSVWANYEKEKNNFYELLVAITSWTDDDFARESKLKKIWSDSSMQPDYIINDFKDIISIVLD